jgi:PKD domain
MRIFSTARRKIAAVAVISGIAIVPFMVLGANAGWGPVRSTFTWDHPATHVTFDSITDNPQVGDERPFLSGKVSNASGDVVDNIHVTNNDEVTLRVYYHNNAASNLNLVATNTRVKFYLPTAAATSTFATSVISADNASPKTVNDTVDFNGDKPFTLEYVKGSAQLWNNKFQGKVLSDDVTTTNGALIGYDKIDGQVPGCAEFSGYVTIKVKVHMQTPPPPVVSFACTGLDVAEVNRTRFDFTAHAEVQNASVTSYSFTAMDSKGIVVDSKTVTTSALSAPYTFTNETPGTYTISAVVNTDHGSTKAADCVKSVSVKTTPPPNVKFACTGLEASQVSDTSFKFTAHGSAENAVISSYNFVAKDANGNTVDTKTVNTSANSAVYDFNQSNPGDYSVSAVVNTDHGSTNPADCVKKVTVKHNKIPAVCSVLTATLGTNRSVTASVTITPAGSAKAISYDFGDGSTPVLTDKTSVAHTYAKDGTYTIAATATFDNSKDQSNTSRCAAQVTITSPSVLPATTTPLPNTGPGDVISLFTGVSAFGAAGHYMVSRRRR